MDKILIDDLQSAGAFRRILTHLQSVDADHHTLTDIAIPANLLMENAGLQTATLTTNLIRKPTKTRAWVFAGPGNNGADALVCARHLMAQKF